MFASERFVPLPGYVVPRPVWDLAHALVERGVELRVDGDDLVVGPSELLTEQDLAALRRWKPHVRALMAYDPPEVH